MEGNINYEKLVKSVASRKPKKIVAKAKKALYKKPKKPRIKTIQPGRLY